MSDGNPRPVKRTKYRACDSCVTSKTRCDDVTPEGCLVCRKRNKSCSLADITPSDALYRPSPSLHPAEEMGELKRRLEQVEARSWEMEQRLKSVESGSSNLRVTPHAVPLTMTENQSLLVDTAVGHDEDIVMETNIGGRTFLNLFDERFFTPVSSKGFPSVVSRGHLSAEQVDLAFQLFKHRFTQNLPLAPFLLSSTPTPSHPFVVLAILTYIPSMSGAYIPSMIEESLRHVMSGAVGEDVVLALLILAMQPAQPAQIIGPSPLRLISMAYQIGLGLGMEALSKASLKHTDRLTQPWWRPTLDRILLWEAIKARYNLMHLHMARVGALALSHAQQLPDHPADNYREAISHLRSVAEIVAIFKDFTDALAEAEADMHFSTLDLPALLDLYKPIEARLPSLFAQSPSLEMDIRCILFSLGIRISIYVQTLPTSWDPSIKAAGYSWMYDHTLKYPFDLARFYVANTTDTPRHTLMVIVLGVSAAGRVLQFYATFGSDPPFYINSTCVSDAEQKLYSVGGVSARALYKLQEQTRGEARKFTGLYKDRMGKGEEKNNVVSVEVANMFDFDFASWESLLGSFGDTLPGMEAVLHSS